MVKRLWETAKRLYGEAAEAVLAPTESGQLWRKVLFFVPVPIPLLAVVALMVGGHLSAAGVWILASGSVAVASLLLASVVQPTPLPEGLSTGASVRRSLHRFRQITSLRIALALTPVAVGAGFAVAGGGLLPLLTALALAWPQLVLAAPTFFVITRARRAMEAWGTKAYLWAGLAQPAPVEWPVATALAARVRAYRAARAEGASAATAATAAGSAGSAEEGDGDADEADEEAEAATGLPSRLATPSGDRSEPSDLLPGFPAETPQARPIPRGTAGRRIGRLARRDRRPKAKS
ncbi:hypothetical protein O4J56_13635 [Nocardiopsis sp. RSe5-2]|uniref:Serine/threonine protein kinase n=1 Tax=Nocardiopsis endophytica TaxID=3018445 RepID=A0ABT4U5Q8_9ACTN|nr:hypothetical protein [Nocardiopsis endophytica]MDA2811677.1 hypothetical protein [Nocardiopsis endophytica]